MIHIFNDALIISERTHHTHIHTHTHTHTQSYIDDPAQICMDAVEEDGAHSEELGFNQFHAYVFKLHETNNTSHTHTQSYIDDPAQICMDAAEEDGAHSEELGFSQFHVNVFKLHETNCMKSVSSVWSPPVT